MGDEAVAWPGRWYQVLWMGLLPDQGAAAGWQMVLPDCAARKNLPLRRRDCCSAGDRGTEEDAAAKKKPLRKERHREAAELRW